MVEASSEWSSNCFRFPKAFVVVAVITVFIAIPNGNFHGAMATPNDGHRNRENINTEGNFRRRYNYRSESDDLYSPYNPLWREEQIYTGERRGPVSDNQNTSLRRPRRTNGGNSPANSPLAPHIHHVDDVSSSMMTVERHRQQQQQYRQQRPGQEDLEDNDVLPTSYSDFPLQSADIGSAYSSSNGIEPRYSEKPRIGIVRGIRKLSFPIDFRRQKGRLNIGYSTDNEPQNQTPSRSDSVRNPSSSRTGNGHKKSDAQVSFSLDPFSLATLLQTGATGILGIASVYVGTLKLLGPMILAKQCLTTVGVIVNNRYHVLDARKLPAKRIGYLENGHVDENHAVAAARAATRSAIQILCMGCAGRFVGYVLDHSPCLLRPLWICQWWYGVVWLASIFAIGSVCQELIFGHLAKTVKIFSFLSIQPTSNPMNLAPQNNSVKIQHKQHSRIQPLFRLIQRMSQNPEEWMNNLFRVIPRWQGGKTSPRSTQLIAESEGGENTEVDCLLFPSTWKPLSILTVLALSRAICQSFSTIVSPSGLTGMLGDDKQYLIMRSFIVQKALDSEWHRVFVQERRVVLGASLSVIGVLALMWSMYSVSVVDPIAATVLVPILMARMVSTWINILLGCNGFEMSTETLTWRSLVSRLNM